MREILFHGKRVDNGEWVDGYYVCLYDCKGNKSHRIYPGYAETDCDEYYHDWFEVDPETVGQFAGFPDKNGNKMFEGDIVTFPWHNDSATVRMRVVFDDGAFLAEPIKHSNGVWTIRISEYNSDF